MAEDIESHRGPTVLKRSTMHGSGVGMAHPAVISTWTITGTRAAAPRRSERSAAATSVRAVRTVSGYALFDDWGRYLGRIATDEHPTFGRGADTVLLSREGGS